MKISKNYLNLLILLVFASISTLFVIINYYIKFYPLYEFISYSYSIVLIPLICIPILFFLKLPTTEAKLYLTLGLAVLFIVNLLYINEFELSSFGGNRDSEVKNVSICKDKRIVVGDSSIFSAGSIRYASPYKYTLIGYYSFNSQNYTIEEKYKTLVENCFPKDFSILYQKDYIVN